MERTVELTSPTITGDMRIWTAFVADGGRVVTVFVHVYAQDWEHLVSKLSLRSATATLKRAIGRRVEFTTQTSFRIDLAELER